MTTGIRVQAAFRKGWPRRRGLLAVLISAALWCAEAYPAGQANGAGRTFEIRGTLIAPEGVDFRRERPFVRLGNPVGPPVTGSEADAKGRFRIKRVPAGMYLLTAYLPRIARVKRTVEVGPSLADARGRIELTIRMERSPVGTGRYQVSVDQLSVPDEARAEFEKGRLQFSRGDLSGAFERFRNATEIAPGFGAAWSQLATVEYFQGKFRDAASHFREASRRLPGNYQVLLSLGAALLAAEDGPAALSVNSRVVDERPGDAQGQAQLGFSLFLLNRLDEAELHLRKAVELDPANFFFPQLQLAEIYRRRNDLASMSRELQEFVELHPDSPKANEVRPILLELKNRLRAAGGTAP